MAAHAYMCTQRRRWQQRITTSVAAAAATSNDENWNEIKKQQKIISSRSHFSRNQLISETTNFSFADTVRDKRRLCSKRSKAKTNQPASQPASQANKQTFQNNFKHKYSHSKLWTNKTNKKIQNWKFVKERKINFQIEILNAIYCADTADTKPCSELLQIV